MVKVMLRWDRIVDVVTIVWLFFFVLGSIRADLESLCDTINLSLLPIFIADLILKYKRVGKIKTFLRHHWFDILITIPYFRFLRSLRILRISRVIKTARTVKVVKGYKTIWIIKEILKFIRAFKKLKRLLKSIAVS